jgi:hypothetical protein
VQEVCQELVLVSYTNFQSNPRSLKYTAASVMYVAYMYAVSYPDGCFLLLEEGDGSSRESSFRPYPSQGCNNEPRGTKGDVALYSDNSRQCYRVLTHKHL